MLGEPELLRVKGAEEPVPVRRLLGMGERHRAAWRAESNLVGRRWERAAVEGLLERAIDGDGAVVEGGDHRVSARAVWCARSPRWRRPGVSTCSPRSANRTPVTSRFTPWRDCCVQPPASGDLDASSRPRAGTGPGAHADPEDLVLLRRPAGHRRSRSGVAQDRSGCPPATVDRARRLPRRWPAETRPSMSLRTCTGSTRSANPCSPTLWL